MMKCHEFCLDRVPLDRRSEELCYLAVKRNPFDIRYVPETEKSARVCMEAMRICMEPMREWSIVKYIPGKYLTRKFCLDFMNEQCGLYKYVPHRILHTKKFLHDVFQARGSSLSCSVSYLPFLKSLPPRLLDDKLLSRICTTIPLAIQNFVPLQTQRYAKKSVLERGSVYWAISEYTGLDWVELLCIALAKSKEPITSFQPIEKYKTEASYEKIVEAAAKSCEDMLFYLSPSLPRYSDFVKTSVSTFGTSLRHLPEDRRTPELCKLAYRTSPEEAAKYFPEGITVESLGVVPRRKSARRS